MLQILYSEEFYDSCSSPDVIKAINQGGCDGGEGGVGFYTHGGEQNCNEGSWSQEPLGKLGLKQDDIIKVDFKA